MTTPKQDKEFNAHFMTEILPGDLLAQTVQYIQDNLEIEEVFTFNQIENWARRNGYRQTEE